MNTMLELKDITVRYGDHTVLDHLSFSLREGEWLMLIGPNGAGKSTAINAVSGEAPYQGGIFVEGQDARQMKPAARARKVGILSQQHQGGYGYTVREIVSLGRYAHSRGFLAGKNEESDRMIAHALELTGMEALQDKRMTELSGGEIQRAFLAQVFAQNPDILILDEPANHLDLVYQKQVFGLIRGWLDHSGRAVISVVHDLSLARRYGSHAVLLRQGRCAAQGAIGEVMTPERLAQVYDMDVYAWMRGLLESWISDAKDMTGSA